MKPELHLLSVPALAPGFLQTHLLTVPRMDCLVPMLCFLLTRSLPMTPLLLSVYPCLLQNFEVAVGSSWLPALGDLPLLSTLPASDVQPLINVYCLVLAFHSAVQVSSCQPHCKPCKGADRDFSTFTSLQPLTQCCVQASVKTCRTKKPNPITQSPLTNLFFRILFEPICSRCFSVFLRVQSTLTVVPSIISSGAQETLHRRYVQLHRSLCWLWSVIGHKGKRWEATSFRRTPSLQPNKKKIENVWWVVSWYHCLEFGSSFIFWKRTIVMWPNTTLLNMRMHLICFFKQICWICFRCMCLICRLPPMPQEKKQNSNGHWFGSLYSVCSLSGVDALPSPCKLQRPQACEVIPAA